MLVADAATIWNSLKGIICVYKPAEVRCSNVRSAVIYKICSGLNEMKCRPPIDRVEIEGDTTRELTVQIVPNVADHINVVGPRYQQEDLPCSWANYLGTNTSGVLLLGLRTGTKWANFIRQNHPVRAYRVRGVLGSATDTFYKVGKIVERTTWKHVKYRHMETMLAAMQAAHQKKMFELCGVDIQSQAAYELAVQGLIRPENSRIPVFYGIKCIYFEPPNFTIEVHCINENESYLKSLIHEIGMKVHSSAYCSGIQCIRHSCFGLEQALLRKHWNLQDIVTNMEQCKRIIQENNFLTKQDNVALQHI